MDKISKHNVVHKYEKKQLLWVINGLAGLSIFFFGYDQVRTLLISSLRVTRLTYETV
jgi:hypothetical protein